MVVYDGAVARLLSNSQGAESENGGHALKGFIIAVVPLVIEDVQRSSTMASVQEEVD